MANAKILEAKQTVVEEITDIANSRRKVIVLAWDRNGKAGREDARAG